MNVKKFQLRAPVVVLFYLRFFCSIIQLQYFKLNTQGLKKIRHELASSSFGMNINITRSNGLLHEWI